MRLSLHLVLVSLHSLSHHPHPYIYSLITTATLLELNLGFQILDFLKKPRRVYDRKMKISCYGKKLSWYTGLWSQHIGRRTPELWLMLEANNQDSTGSELDLRQRWLKLNKEISKPSNMDKILRQVSVTAGFGSKHGTLWKEALNKEFTGFVLLSLLSASLRFAIFICFLLFNLCIKKDTKRLVVSGVLDNENVETKKAR